MTRMIIEESFPLKCCKKCKNANLYIDECKYYSDKDCAEQFFTLKCKDGHRCEEIYKMLTEQLENNSKPVKPIPIPGTPGVYRCGNCQFQIIRWESIHFCAKCGIEIDWND